MACGISVPQSGIIPVLPAVEAQNLNHWTTSEVLHLLNANFFFNRCLRKRVLQKKEEKKTLKTTVKDIVLKYVVRQGTFFFNFVR